VILEARDLTIGYRDRVVGRGLNLGLADGEVIALLGPNGSGKTTLLKTLLGLIPPLDGVVWLAGQQLNRLTVQERARLIAYVPQVHAGAFAFSVEDVVLMGRNAHADLLSRPSARDRVVAAEMIARLGIGHLAQRPSTMISGGERQLALIARALAQEPRVVVLDEPTASLDFGNQGKVMREIRALAAAGLAVIFSTHDPNHALRFADRAMLIQAGSCIAGGVSRDILTREALESLYQTRIETIESNTARVFLPD
jgi:iron complex transport system ATP-binding protein